ncbi:MAG: glycosyltransferase family 4 protein [Pseudomonadota bacterium]|nr:glycosyltransferase family 4 protein [Pseudomonadota bacterium]
MSSARSRLHLAAQYLRPGNGGIAEVARVSAKALARLAPTRGHACMERGDFAIEGAPVRAYGGSRARFLIGLERASLAPGRFLYDFAGSARSAALLWPRRPYAVWAHGIEVWDEVRADRAAALARADLVLVNSAYTLARAEPTLGKLANVKLCRLGAYADEAAPLAPPSGPPTALLLGRVEPGWPKGQGVLVSLWPRVVAAVPDARLLLVGKGPGLEPLRELARQSSAAASIEVAGFVPEDEIEAVWARASVFAMPSLTEGFGLVFIEAMRRGLPVIASLADAGAEVNVDGSTGFNLARDNEGRLVEALVGLLRERDLAARMGEQGQRRWRDEFSFSAFARRLEAATAGFLG